MGGTNETKISKLRCHVNNGEVHIHDDNGSKFIKNANAFKREAEDAMGELRGREGVIIISGNGKPDLCIGNHDGNSFMAIVDDNCWTDLNTFIRSI